MVFLRAYDNEITFDRYTVIFNDSVYTMSHNANSPAGCCIYYGEKCNNEKETGKPIERGDLPIGVQGQIEYITSLYKQEIKLQPVIFKNTDTFKHAQANGAKKWKRQMKRHITK